MITLAIILSVASMSVLDYFLYRAQIKALIEELKQKEAEIRALAKKGNEALEIDRDCRCRIEILLAQLEEREKQIREGRVVYDMIKPLVKNQSHIITMLEKMPWVETQKGKVK